MQIYFAYMRSYVPFLLLHILRTKLSKIAYQLNRNVFKYKFHMALTEWTRSWTINAKMVSSNVFQMKNFPAFVVCIASVHTLTSPRFSFHSFFLFIDRSVCSLVGWLVGLLDQSVYLFLNINLITAAFSHSTLICR